MTREGALAELCVRLADTLNEQVEIGGLLQHLVERCVALFDVDAAAVLLRHQDGRPEVVAATCEGKGLGDLQIRLQQGPGLRCADRGDEVVVPDLRSAAAEWPGYVNVAAAQGIAAVHAVPLRHRVQVLGALELLRNAPGRLPDEDVVAVRGLAHIAAIGLIRHRALASSALLADQLQTALHSRVVIEQAKGFLAVAGGLELDEAFLRLRSRARSRNQLLSDVSRAVVERQLDPRTLLD